MGPVVGITRDERMTLRGKRKVSVAILGAGADCHPRKRSTDGNKNYDYYS